jgi:DNA (cytosine-5)-methyltransferase 1
VKKSYLTVTDQFCGAGGSSLGATAVPDLNVYLAMNHWQLAIETHNTNFPDTLHDCADISATDPRRYPSTDILVTSPECTNHSLAKGAKKPGNQLHLWEKRVLDPAAERSRATMFDVPRFAEYHDYNLVVVENVIDVRKWKLWDAWILAMTSLDYDYHIVYFNSMFAHLDPGNVQNLHDFAPQSRDRMYVVFWKRGNKRPDLDFRPRAYCRRCEDEVKAVQAWKQTDAVRAMGGRWGRYGVQYVYACPSCSSIVHPYYFAAFNAIDWSLLGRRIGDIDPPLKPKTIKRIEDGARRFAGRYMLIDTLYTDKRPRPMAEAMFTQTTRQSLAVAAPGFTVEVCQRSDSGRVRGLDETLFTQSTAQSQGMVMMPFLTIQYTPGYNKAIDEPLAAVTTQDHHGLVQPAPFFASLRGANQPKGTDEPLDTFAAGGNHHGLVMPAPFLTSYYGSGGSSRPVSEAMGALTSNDRHGLVMPFLLGYANGNSPARSAAEPLRTMHTENGHGLVQPGEPGSVEDYYFRVLRPHEVGRGMAFPDSYVVLGTNKDQVKQYGNAVTPPVMRMILERCVATLR